MIGPEQLSGKRKGRRKHKSQRLAGLRFRDRLRHDRRPFAYVRPGSRIGSHVRCGDFVEVKNSTIGDGTKISHLTYIGDSDVGRDINFGCGTVTVNYDRVKKKSRTVIDDNAFIGCNANLIAPVHIGEGAYIAARSTVTDDVPPQRLPLPAPASRTSATGANRHKLKEKK